MSRKELADAGSISPRTMYSYIDSVWATLVSYGCEKRKRLTPAAVQYMCEHFGISL